MAKLLQSRLPYYNPYYSRVVDAISFNRFVRILELNLDAFDPSATPQFTSADRDQRQFAAGDIIWNTTEGVLQVYLGNVWQNISTPSTSGLSATGSVGAVQVVTNGNIVVAL